jgi:threonine/homoserine/homoserine lactone efflux protein
MIEVSWFRFVLASLMLIATPGQAMMIVISRSVPSWRLNADKELSGLIRSHMQSTCANGVSQ